MISWNTLCYNLTALAELPNGGGAEIEFCLNGKQYFIVRYRQAVTLTYTPDGFDVNGNSVEYRYSSMEELGAARDFGFTLKDEWNNVTDYVCRPSFDDFTLDEILEGYKKAWNGRNRR